MLNYLHFIQIRALSLFYWVGASSIPFSPGMLGGHRAPGLSIAARIAGTCSLNLFLSFARDVAVRNTGAWPADNAGSKQAVWTKRHI